MGLDKITIDGATINIPITVDDKVVESFMKEVQRESDISRKQGEHIISLLEDIKNIMNIGDDIR